MSDDAVAVFKFHDKLFLAKMVHAEVDNLTQNLLERIIHTSVKPTSVIMRTQALQNAKIKASVWLRALMNLEEAGLGKTPGEAALEYPKTELVVTDLANLENQSKVQP